MLTFARSSLRSQREARFASVANAPQADFVALEAWVRLLLAKSGRLTQELDDLDERYQAERKTINEREKAERDRLWSQHESHPRSRLQTDPRRVATRHIPASHDRAVSERIHDLGWQERQRLRALLRRFSPEVVDEFSKF